MYSTEGRGPDSDVRVLVSRLRFTPKVCLHQYSESEYLHPNIRFFQTLQPFKCMVKGSIPGVVLLFSARPTILQHFCVYCGKDRGILNSLGKRYK